MKNLFCLLLLGSIQLNTSAQFRVNFMTGMANYKGDLQQKELTFQNAHHVHSIGLSYNITGHISVRLDLSATKLEAQDQDNKDASLRRRNLNFKTNLAEVSLMAQYDVFSLSNYKMTPYFFGGIAAFSFNSYTMDSTGGKIFLQPLSTEGQGLPQYPDRKVYSTNQYSIPFGVGIKYALSEYVHIGGELGTRKLFTDYLDDVSNNYVDENILRAEKGPQAADYAFRGDELKSNPWSYPVDGTGRGNPVLNDNYYFGEVRLSIKLPWFETGRSIGRSKLKQYSCPRF